MKKIIFLLATIFISTLLFTQTMTVNCIGFKKHSGNPLGIKEGETIKLGDNIDRIVEYSCFGDWINVDGVHADEDEDKIWVDKFTELIPSVGSYDSSVKVAISNWGWEGIGLNKKCWFDIVCPNVDGIKSIQIRFGMYGIDLIFTTIYCQSYSSYVEILSDPITPDDPPIGYYRYLYESMMVELKLGTDTGQIIIPKVTDWENIIVTYDKTDFKVYMDNVLIDTKTMGDLSANYSTTGLVIGGCYYYGGSFSEGFIGSEDEVAIFNKVLTAADRLIIMGGGAMKTVGDCREISGLKAYWRFDEPSGTTVTDWAKP